MITRKGTWRHRGVFGAALTTLFIGTLAGGAGSSEIDVALEKAMDIPAFVQSIAKDKTKTVPSIRSDKMTGGAKSGEPSNRPLGQALIDALEKRENISFQDLTTRTVATLELRDWALGKAGYGNLLVAYAAEAAAMRLIFRSLAAPNSNVTNLEDLVKRLQAGTPSPAYWLDVLNTEEVANPLSQEELNKNDAERKALLFRKLTDKATAVDDVPDLPSADIRSCYQRRSLPRVAFLAVVQEQEVAALRACIEARKTGHLPADEATFKAIIKKSASAILNDKKRLGGLLTSGQVWRLWRQYGAPDSPMP